MAKMSMVTMIGKNVLGTFPLTKKRSCTLMEVVACIILISALKGKLISRSTSTYSEIKLVSSHWLNGNKSLNSRNIGTVVSTMQQLCSFSSVLPKTQSSTSIK